MQPHGLCQLKSFLTMHGYEVKLVDMLVQAFLPKEMRRIIREFEPDVVGISTFTQCIGMAFGLCRLVKKINPQIVTILGGAHVTVLPKDSLEKEPAIDYVVVGEGESTLIELLEALQHPGLRLDGIMGLSYRQGVEGGGVQIRINESRQRLECLDILPFSDNSDLPLDTYTAAYTLVSSRGCPGQCIFCAAGALSGSRQRGRSAENIFGEVYHLYYVYKPAFFLITDDTFTVSHRRLRRFCDLMIAAELDAQWWCESRVQGMTRELLGRMAQAGCESIQFGVESGSQEVLDNIRKHMSLDKLHQVLRAASELGIRAVCSMIIGHYCDTPETMQQTVDLARMLKEEYGAAVLVSINTLFPGTYQYDHRDELGLQVYSEDWDKFDLSMINVRGRHFDREVLAKYYFEVKPYISSRELVREIFSKRRWKLDDGQLVETPQPATVLSGES
jgi:radical SAM superfamily enzyme YgiQ (UPF0313 family)